MVVSIFGYLFLFVGLLILFLPLMLVELSRPRDWLMGGLFLFLGLFLLLEKDIFGGSISLLVFSMGILYGKMSLEIIHARFYQLSSDEKTRIVSFRRWFDTFKELSQIFLQLTNVLINFLKSFFSKSEKSLVTKKWIHPKLKEEIRNKSVEQENSADSNKIFLNQELTQNEESS